MLHTSSSSRTPHDPLKGIRVVDFTIVMSGPLCTRALADAGADVIKIEPPAGDMVRNRPPTRSGVSTYFGSMNCGKRGIVLDLSTPEGREIALGLALQADVIVENFRPGVMKRLGLDYDSLSARRPGLIYCSISGFGQSGPMAHAPAYAPVIHAASGLDMANMSYQTDPSRPGNNGIFIADVLGASQAASAIHLALFDRERTGKGQWIDVSLMDAVLGMLVYETQVAQQPTNRRRQVYEPVRSRDGFVMVAAVTPKNMEALFDLIGFPAGKTDPRFANTRTKEENWSELLRIIESWTSQRSSSECEDLMMAAGVPCARYRTVTEALAEPQVAFRGTLAHVGTAEEPFQVVNPAYRLSNSRIEARRCIPQLGEHTEEVLQELLGASDEQLEAWRDKGVLGASRAPA
ncbi:CaiB/BaiF CoA transferase family protein [Hydrogenophaga laconesensis]|uniref:Crotonobetainyl-CoA:carnitine CoA-transferase CaiB-like acyl-CoA transferase n=1 Tax=Hydrogenophaga laconesensis TaxID=1805971 RepID=A0ABU1VJ21_9BURK|nr:CoA transferase [Hydrogenophaga laconesensis]MDR7097464.1 crotonobetainyl-CoA:carnitine CoA-transferase CaiB-like acyl-CoA transferase [Hydrogenophaga laconesensis]